MITRGTILVEQGTLVPTSFQLRTESYPSQWMTVGCKLNADELETELNATGWTFFYMAGEVRATAFGFDRDKAVHSALKRLLAGVELQNCNCLEIDEVANHSFFGMPWVSVCGHSRRIQKGQVFTNLGSTSPDNK